MNNKKFTEKFIKDYFTFVEECDCEPDFYNYFRKHHDVQIKYFSPITNPKQLAKFEAIAEKSSKVITVGKLFNKDFDQAAPAEQIKTLGEFTRALHQLWGETEHVSGAINGLSYYPVVITINGKENKFMCGSDAENFLRGAF